MRLLRADEIDCRVGQVFKKQEAVGCLLYKDARVDMQILDEEFGVNGWQRTHEVIDGQLYCNSGYVITEEVLSGYIGIYATRGSTIHAENAIASGAGYCGIFATRGSTISAQGANANGSGQDCITAIRGSIINAENAVARGGGVNGDRKSVV